MRGVAQRVACWPVVHWDASSSLQLRASFRSRGLAMRRAMARGKTLCQQIVQRGGGASRPRGRFRSAGLRQDPHSLGILAGWSGTIKWSNLSWFRSAWEYSNIYFFPPQFAALPIAADPCSCKPQRLCVGSQLAEIFWPSGPSGLVSDFLFDFSDRHCCCSCCYLTADTQHCAWRQSKINRVFRECWRKKVHMLWTHTVEVWIIRPSEL